jgi:hypothetical protein
MRKKLQYQLQWRGMRVSDDVVTAIPQYYKNFRIDECFSHCFRPFTNAFEFSFLVLRIWEVAKPSCHVASSPSVESRIGMSPMSDASLMSCQE